MGTWRGLVYVAFVIDDYAHRIVGWRVASRPRTDLALDALEQAPYVRAPDAPLMHHSERSVQFLAIPYTERLAEAGLEASVGSHGNSFHNALAENRIS